MVMEDAEAPHHMLLLRNFMSQGLVHNQPLLYASPSKDPRQFLGTLPSPAVPKDDKSSHRDPDQVVLFFNPSLYVFVHNLVFWVNIKKLILCFLKFQEKGLRIAWQYKKYFGENQHSFDSQGGKFVLTLFL